MQEKPRKKVLTVFDKAAREMKASIRKNPYKLDPFVLKTLLWLMQESKNLTIGVNLIFPREYCGFGVMFDSSYISVKRMLPLRVGLEVQGSIYRDGINEYTIKFDPQLEHNRLQVTKTVDLKIFNEIHAMTLP